MKKYSKTTINFGEFVTLMAFYVALMAMSIDTILPALSLIGQEFGVTDENKTQFIIGTLFLGFTFGQVLFGPMADSFGRKPTVYAGLAIFIFGTILSVSAKSFEIMLLGRFLQGFGASSPRTTSLAIIRDLYKGRDMARVMSFIMTIFIITPVVAPAIGQAILLVASWHLIFYIFLVMAVIAFFWTFLRLPETLKKQDVRPFNLPTIGRDFAIVFKNKITLGYSICTGLIFSALIGYLTCSRQIFQDYFGVGKLFPLYFAMSALAIGAASILNSVIVRRLGMKLICRRALLTIMIVSAIFLPICLLNPHQTPLFIFMIFMLITFFCVGLLFGNLNALAMEPMGHYAGVASAVVGFLSSGISVIIGTVIGQFYNNTLIPITIGFLSLAIISFLLLIWLEPHHESHE